MGRRKAPPTPERVAELPLIPRAIIRIAIALKLGLLANPRKASFKSVNIVRPVRVIPCVTLGPDRPGPLVAPATNTRATRSRQVTRSLRRAEPDCALRPHRVATQSIDRAQLPKESRSPVQ